MQMKKSRDCLQRRMEVIFFWMRYTTCQQKISGFQVFDVIYMMIGKTNPAYANTQTVVMLFYRQAFDYGYKGHAAAISILIFAVIMLVTVIQMIGQKKWVNYD